MSPITVTVEHHSTPAEVRARIDARLDRIRAEAAPYVSAIDCTWRGDTLDFRLQALAQSITGTVEVEERVVRITLALPALLGLFGKRIAAAIGERTPKLIGP